MSSFTFLSGSTQANFMALHCFLKLIGGNFSPFPAPVSVWSSPSMLYQLLQVWLFLNSWLSCFNWLQQLETTQIEVLSELVFCNYVREDGPQAICPSLAQGKKQEQRVPSLGAGRGKRGGRSGCVPYWCQCTGQGCPCEGWLGLKWYVLLPWPGPEDRSFLMILVKQLCEHFLEIRRAWSFGWKTLLNGLSILFL